MGRSLPCIQTISTCKYHHLNGSIGPRFSWAADYVPTQANPDGYEGLLGFYIAREKGVDVLGGRGSWRRTAVLGTLAVVDDYIAMDPQRLYIGVWDGKNTAKLLCC